jgi:predicted aspartyl protease
VISFDYERDYEGGSAAPVIELRVQAIGAPGEGVAVQALIDSGAEATVLPLDALVTAGVEQVGQARLRWGRGPAKPYDVYLTAIAIGPYRLPGVRVLADGRFGEAIVGRDVLNQLIVTLNGPGYTTQIEM